MLAPGTTSAMGRGSQPSLSTEERTGPRNFAYWAGKMAMDGMYNILISWPPGDQSQPAPSSA